MNAAPELNAPAVFKGPFFGLPIVWDETRANEVFQDLRNRISEIDDANLRSGLQSIIEEPVLNELLRSIFANSPFLTQCALSDLSFLAFFLEQGLDTGLGHVFDAIRDDLSRETDVNRLKKELRIARKRVALLVAVADIAGIWSLERVTQALSDFADVAISAAISHILIAADEKGDIALHDKYFPEFECGYFALAMGKYGARELNYSSDIDLIVIYDPVKIDYRGSRSVQQLLIRLTRELVSILQDVTADGYVFRVDLRLRPDPGSTPVAIPYANALGYYETRGAGWERAAMIKARPAVGDLRLGRQFMAELAPFIWRPRVDFWAQREMAKIKRQINEHRGSAEIGYLGHNIKLGRGGIREIEFFAQSHQLVYGGRDFYLRSIRTLDALSTLAEAGHIDDATADQLTEAYEFLRQLEHRLQMVNDQQTQTLPDDDAGMRHVASFMGYADTDNFRDSLLQHLRTVEATYTSVFEVEEPAQVQYDFQLESKTDETIELLGESGFEDAGATYERIRRWQTGAYAAFRDPRSQELIAELIPRIIDKAAASTKPDLVIKDFDRFFTQLKSGVASLSTLASSPRTFDFLFDALSKAPLLSDVISRWPARLETLVSRTGFEPVPDARVLRAECARLIKAAPNEELAYQAGAEWANQQRLAIAEMVLYQSIDWAESSGAFSEIADAALQSYYQSGLHDDANDRDVETASIALAAIGQYGARELTFAGPCDILVFTAEESDELTAARQLSRRLLLAVAAATQAGKIVEVNFNQTGYGTRGPIVTQIRPFLSHCQTEDGLWALLALPQLRCVFGSNSLMQDVNDAIVEFLRSGAGWRCLAERSSDLLALLRSPSSASIWDVRHCQGGLAELEVLIASLQIKAAHHADVLTPSRGDALSKLIVSDQLEEEAGKRLIEAHHVMRQVESFLAVATGRLFDVGALQEQTASALARACGAGKVEELEGMLREATATVRATVDANFT